MADGGAGEYALIAAMLGSGALSAMGRGQDYTPIPFQNDSNTVPDALLQQVRTLLNTTESRIRNKPITFASVMPDAYVQGMPSFTGGGLPMPIGLTGKDPRAYMPNGQPGLTPFTQGTPDYPDVGTQPLPGGPGSQRDPTPIPDTGTPPPPGNGGGANSQGPGGRDPADRPGSRPYGLTLRSLGTGAAEGGLGSDLTDLQSALALLGRK